MKITILTLFPEMFDGPFAHSIVKRAQEKGLVEIELIDIRQFGLGSHQMVDDTPFGGGIGMVMRVDVLHKAVQHAKQSFAQEFPQEAGKQWVVLLSASGTPYTQSHAKSYASNNHLILICGHYEGVDERIHQYIDEEVSVGDFVVTGGEIPAMLITDSVTRLVEGVLKEGATANESFSHLTTTDSLDIHLEYPQYTHPRAYDGQQVPDVLYGGNHKVIQAWREAEAIKKTKSLRPDLLSKDK